MKATRTFKMFVATCAALTAVAVAPAVGADASSAIPVRCTGSGGGTAGLIAAINTANSNGGGTILLAAGCTYALTSPNNTPPKSGPNGLPVIASPITIVGANTTIAGNHTNFRIFEVDGPGGNLTLDGLTLTGGSSQFGGAIVNGEGAVTLNHSIVRGNTALMAGGGIASGILNPNQLGPIGTLTLNFSQVTGNTTIGSGGQGGGGGIANRAGTVTLNFSRVSGNSSPGGGGISSGPGNGGGPVSTAGTSSLVLNASQVNNNTATGGPAGGGGGIANGGSATITLSQVSNNSAPGGAGAGLLNHGTATITLSQVNNNTAPQDTAGDDGIGGGIANANFGVGNSGILTLNLSQVDHNSASGPGGGIADVGFANDGTPTAPAGPLALKLSEVAGNTAAVGGGIYTSPGSPVTLALSAIHANAVGNCFPTGTITGCVG